MEIELLRQKITPTIDRFSYNLKSLLPSCKSELAFTVVSRLPLHRHYIARIVLESIINQTSKHTDTIDKRQIETRIRPRNPGNTSVPRSTVDQESTTNNHT